MPQGKQKGDTIVRYPVFCAQHGMEGVVWKGVETLLFTSISNFGTMGKLKYRLVPFSVGNDLIRRIIGFLSATVGPNIAHQDVSVTGKSLADKVISCFLTVSSILWKGKQIKKSITLFSHISPISFIVISLV